MFRTGMMTVIQQKNSRKDGSCIDRSGDIEYLWGFYKMYKGEHRVADLLGEEQEWGGHNDQFPLWLELRYLEMRKVIVISRVFVEVMAALGIAASTGFSWIEDPHGVGRLIMNEVNWLRIEGDEPLNKWIEKLFENEDGQSLKLKMEVVEETNNTTDGADRKDDFSNDGKPLSETTSNELSTGQSSTSNGYQSICVISESS